MDFAQCLLDAGTPEFIERFNQITGYDLRLDSDPNSEDCLAFALFVEKYIWRPTLDELGLPFESQIHDHPMMGKLRIEI
jgi:hypothetical protein